MSDVEIIAHRGYSARAPENTLAALRLAIEARADAVEFDVHVTADGEPVLFHDFTLERTSSGRGRLDALPLEALRELDVGAWFGTAFAGECMATLREALDLLARDRHPHGPIRRVYPEIKGWRDDADAARIVDELRLSGWADAACVISLDWDVLERVRGHDRDLQLGLVFDDDRLFDGALELAAGDGRTIVDPDFRILLARPGRVEEARRRRVDVACWTVNDTASARRLLDLGVRRLTTNEVELLRSVP
ncbi:MAG TPA: glycerophosphodiester phosphodiesterase family protein [Longimicrobiales bacterium]|nr:glycerophosphodiester phosphodiesterase family protein [Longimicrobiales bacterium]